MLRKILTTTAAATFALSSISAASLTALTFSADMAIAGNGKGNNGNGNGNGNRNNGNGNSNGNSQGSIASSLGALNAAHANPNALANAAPNSRVGLIATYQREAQLTNDLAAAEADALAELLLLVPAPRPIDVIQAEIELAIIAGLNTDLLEAELAATVAYNDAATDTLEQQQDENAALEAAANKDVPTGEALDALRTMLGLE